MIFQNTVLAITNSCSPCLEEKLLKNDIFGYDFVILKKPSCLTNINEDIFYYKEKTKNIKDFFILVEESGKDLNGGIWKYTKELIDFNKVKKWLLEIDKSPIEVQYYTKYNLKALTLKNQLLELYENIILVVNRPLNEDQEDLIIIDNKEFSFDKWHKKYKNHYMVDNKKIEYEVVDTDFDEIKKLLK